MQLKCESLVKRTVMQQGKPRKIKDPIPCNEPGTAYKVRRPYAAGPIVHGHRGSVSKQASVTIFQVLCARHKKIAIEQGFECIPVVPETAA